MKKSTICIIIAATTLGGAFQTVQAGEKERYLIGGLLGGWILNEVTHDSPQPRVHRDRPVHVETCSPVIVETHPVRSRPSGRYEYQQVKTWIPGHHERVRQSCGRTITRWVSGRYDIRTEKVWVSYENKKSNRYDDRSRRVACR